MVLVVLGRAPELAPNCVRCVGLGAGCGAQRFRLCWCERRGWRQIAPVSRCRAPGVAPNNFGGAGVRDMVGDQWLRWRGAGRQGWRPATSVVLGRAPGLAPDRFGGGGPGAGGGAQWLRWQEAGRQWWRLMASVFNASAKKTCCAIAFWKLMPRKPCAFLCCRSLSQETNGLIVFAKLELRKPYVFSFSLWNFSQEHTSFNCAS